LLDEKLNVLSLPFTLFPGKDYWNFGKPTYIFLLND